MKILAIHGSPRKGNTEILLNEALKHCKKYFNEINFLNPCNLNISGCTACEGCKETGQCIIGDDMDIVYPLLRQADRIIIATPIFFFGIPAQFKTLIDRCQSLWYEKYIIKKSAPETNIKKALVILVGGMKKGEIGITCAEATLKAFLRTINFKTHETLSYLGYDEPGSILKNPAFSEDIKLATERLLEND